MSQPLPRFTQDRHVPHIDPLDAMLAKRELEHQQAIALIDNGKTPLSDSTDARRLRGIPCIAEGVTGTSPGTDPLRAVLATDHRLRRTTAA